MQIFLAICFYFLSFSIHLRQKRVMWQQSECCSSGLYLTIFHFFARKFYIFELIFLLLQKFVRKKTEITNKNSAKQWKR